MGDIKMFPNFLLQDSVSLEQYAQEVDTTKVLGVEWIYVAVTIISLKAIGTFRMLSIYLN